MPEGPGAVPLGKDCKALAISSSDMQTASGTGEDGMGGGAACGCFPSTVSNTLVDVGVMLAGEDLDSFAILTVINSTASMIDISCSREVHVPLGLMTVKTVVFL